MGTVKALADRYHSGWLAAHPFDASYVGVPGYDEAVPDASPAGEDLRRSEVEVVLAEADSIDATMLNDADAVTLGCLRSNAEAELFELAAREGDHLVTTMPFKGPAFFLGVAARASLPDARAAADYLSRLAAAGPWIDQQVENLRAGAAKGRLPVSPLVENTIRWAEPYITSDVPEPLTAPNPPDSWDGASAWLERRDALARDVVRPALVRWVAQLQQLLPRARPADRPGLVYLPGGDADYQAAIQVNTTLPLTADELHQDGLDEVERLEARAVQLGSMIGLRDLEAVHRAAVAASGGQDPTVAIDAARRAVRRAEEVISAVISPPYPPPCEVTPMPAVVAAAGAPPHYSPPRMDGTQPGTYWFNTEQPTAGAGWDLEVTAFHEAVPGHHLQVARLQAIRDLPAMQRDREVNVFSEGWGLYTEQLADEIDLYSSAEALLGATTMALMRAARLVIDTGLHAHGWSRNRAMEYFAEHVPLPPEFRASEVDRYISWPGQALSYQTGKQQILRIRAETSSRVGASFSLPTFHSQVLDSGFLPIPVLEAKLARWRPTSAPPT
jgi:uncharacterized protein (DUF885 family)